MNKTKLLASTMLVSASVLMTAGSASALDIKLGGFVEQWIGYADNDAAGGARSNLDVKSDSEIYFKGEQKLDNGVTVGFLLEMEAGAGHDGGVTDFDESFVYVKTSLGQVNLGANDVASAYVGGVSVVGPIGLIKSDANDWFAQAAGNLSDTDGDVGISDAQNITYMTPSIAGFQAIVSFTPDSSNNAASAFDNQENAGFHNGMSGALNYAGKAGSGKFGLGVGYTNVELDDAAGVGSSAEAIVTNGWAELGALKFSASYAKENVAAAMDEFYGVGVIYKVKNDAFSLGYSKGESSQRGVGVADTSSKLITLGYERTLGKGVTFGASAFKVSNNQATAATSNDGIGVVGGLVLKF